MKKQKGLSFLFFVAAFFLFSCQKPTREIQNESPQKETRVETVAKHQLVVPDEVKAAFGGVTLRLKKKDGSFDQTFDVPLGELTALGKSGLAVNVPAFLPAFYMDRTRISSVGVRETNPAAKVTLFEKGKEIHSGWLFATMPAIHPFVHDIFSLTLEKGVKK